MNRGTMSSTALLLVKYKVITFVPQVSKGLALRGEYFLMGEHFYEKHFVKGEHFEESTSNEERTFYEESTFGRIIFMRRAL